jgi:hypothetical protein
MYRNDMGTTFSEIEIKDFGKIPYITKINAGLSTYTDVHTNLTISLKINK